MVNLLCPNWLAPVVEPVSAMRARVDQRRIRSLNEEPIRMRGPVVYWMSRDQRADDNWALLYAQELALASKVPLVVSFCLAPKYLNALPGQYSFMLAGLRQLEDSLRKRNIPLTLLLGEPPTSICALVEELSASCVVTDFNPLRISKKWKREAARALNIPLLEVDAHNIVPCWVASQKQEYGAYTFRPKLKRLMETFLVEFPALLKHPITEALGGFNSNWRMAYDIVGSSRNLRYPAPPGSRAAALRLNDFINNKLEDYSSLRNDPSKDAQSGLSPYIHYGQISAQRVALEVMASSSKPASKDEFLDELIVRRELSDNFCEFNPHYDSFSAFPDWAKATLDVHRADERAYIYTKTELEQSKTHDELWNAAQREMVVSGKMHGYMRMYWAKKILEWTESPEQAMKTANYLNDRYQLDGRDPNGYAGIAWSIGGLHDRAWNARPVFGKVRYMSYEGCKRKFNIGAYIARVDKLVEDAVKRKTASW